MVFPRSSLMLSASLILFLLWMNFSAQARDPTSSSLSPSYRVKRDLPPNTRDNVAKSSQVVKDTLTVVKDVIGLVNTKTLSSNQVLKGLANFAALAPGIVGLASSIVAVVLAFTPQKDPFKEEFAEVNRKLDSLSIQMSNLATDIEWFNYISIYSQDEIRIVNAWKKFNEFRENSQRVHSEEGKLHLAKIFTNYYENTAAEASVDNLYHYLTVSSTSLSGNLNDLLRKKFKCDIGEIGKYNLYFSSLLWKGMMLNQVYWNLIGFNPSEKEEQTQMFKNVYKAQKLVWEFCLNNYWQYMEADVVEITKAHSPDNKKGIADQVKKVLDKKYDWYNWVVLVYNTDQEEYMIFHMGRIPVDKITVALGYSAKGEKSYNQEIKKAANKCFQEIECEDFSSVISNCHFSYTNGEQGKTQLTNFAKIVHVIIGDDFAVAPEPFHHVRCYYTGVFLIYTYPVFMHYSVSMSACDETCGNNGWCRRLHYSNEFLCDCRDNYFGEKCEKKMNISKISVMNTPSHLPQCDSSTMDKLTRMEAKLEKKLEEIHSTVSDICVS